MIPGEYFFEKENIECNMGRETIKIMVSNTGDRPIQVGSHFHFFETNKFLDFHRANSFGMRLDIAAGTAVRFEPGEEKEVQLVKFGGNQVLHGFNGLVCTKALDKAKDVALKNAKELNFKGVE